MNKTKKIYYRIEFCLTSPMNIGSGDNSNSDKDMIKDSKNMPYIPGSSLAGIFRAFFQNKDLADKYFGKVDINRTDNNSDNILAKESKIRIYDANICCGTPIVTKRDCVALDEYRTGIKGAKFDFEILEAGVHFVTYLEQDIDSECSEDIGNEIISNWVNKGLLLGSKTMRGLGETEIINVYCAEFDFEDRQNLEKWLDFDMYAQNEPQSDNIWTKVDLEKLNNKDCFSEDCVEIELELSQKSGISIRKYTTAVSEDGETQPDFTQLTNADGNPVIPGTSWAGVFKHSMEKSMGKSCHILFGSAEQKSKSKILFSESIIKDASSKVLTRNAINRFTGGAKDSALYTEKYYYDGNTTLKISTPLGDHINALVNSIFDLHFGFLTVGGLSGIGRGLFEITKAKINGNPVMIPIITDLNSVSKAYSVWTDALGGGGKDDRQ